MDTIVEIREMLSLSKLEAHHMSRMLLFLIAERDPSLREVAEAYILQHLSEYKDILPLPSFTVSSQTMKLETALTIYTRSEMTFRLAYRGRPTAMSSTPVAYGKSDYKAIEVTDEEVNLQPYNGGKPVGKPWYLKKDEVLQVYRANTFRWMRIDAKTSDYIDIMRRVIETGINRPRSCALAALDLAILGQLGEDVYLTAEIGTELQVLAEGYAERFPDKELRWGDKLLLEL